MKVLFVSSGNKFPLGNTIVVNQMNSLSEIGIEAEHFLVKGNGTIGYIRNIGQLSKHIRNGNFSIIHSHYSLSAFISTMACIFNNPIPHIVSLMGSDIYLKGILRLITRFLSKWIWTDTIVKSESMLKELSLEDAHVIPNGVDIKKIMDIERELLNNKQLNQAPQKPTLLFAADPKRPEKNFELAKEASVLSKVTLIVVYGKAHNELIAEILKSGIVILTSDYEGSPNIIKEAMVCNRPIVSTDVGDVKSLFGKEQGHFIAGSDAIEFANNIRKAIGFYNKFYKTKGRDRIIELGLSDIIIAEKIKNLYSRYCDLDQ